ncbi:ribbon-helix-helix domain-containing protein [Novosphingobium sp.]|uniref:ribbon-helix-helix domain-containing protein n=1 Tax=Novosphingobium sp. TaxID=1874826 RepID=UPI0031D6F757
MTKRPGNSLQAILNRASAEVVPVDEQQAAPPQRGRRAASSAAAVTDPAQVTATGRAVQRNRVGMKLIGGHFPAEVSTQLKILAAEEGTTVQQLLDEAIADLLTKKAARKVAR